MKKVLFHLLLSCWMFVQIGCKKEKVTKEATTHREVMNLIMKEQKMHIKTIGILLYDDFFSLDAMGPMSVLSELMDTKVFFVGVKKGIIRNYQMQVKVDTSIAEVKDLDMLLIPGGYISTYLLTQDTAVTNWIKMIDQKTKITASVCTGAWLLGAAGLLNGKKATTHWYYKAQDILKAYGARTVKRRYVNDGKYWTSAGVSAGMDMSLAIVNEIRGNAYLQAVMLDLEYNPEPPLRAGHPDNSDKAIVDMMVAMYDMGLQPVLDSVTLKPVNHHP